jgi:hypothetical protein
MEYRLSGLVNFVCDLHHIFGNWSQIIETNGVPYLQKHSDINMLSGNMRVHTKVPIKWGRSNLKKMPK